MRSCRATSKIPLTHTHFTRIPNKKKSKRKRGNRIDSTNTVTPLNCLISSYKNYHHQHHLIRFLYTRTPIFCFLPISWEIQNKNKTLKTSQNPNRNVVWRAFKIHWTKKKENEKSVIKFTFCDLPCPLKTNITKIKPREKTREEKNEWT